MFTLTEKSDENQILSQLSDNPYAIAYQCTPFKKSQTAGIIHAASKLSDETMTLLDFHHGQADHYTFIGIKPFASITAKDKKTQITQGKESKLTNDNPFKALKKLKKNIQPKIQHRGTRLTASAVGRLGYPAIQYLETFKTRHKNTLNLPDIKLHFFSIGIYLDHQQNTLTVSQLITASENRQSDYQHAMQTINKILQQLSQPVTATPTPHHQNTSFSTDIEDQDFCELVNKAKQAIYAGETFQLVLSRTFSCDFIGDPFTLYRKMQENNPSPYHFMLRESDYTLVGASPEKIIRVQNGQITSTPLAGTRSYTNNQAEKIQELLNNEKERAEHLMLVDLARNDVGKVAKTGTVKTHAIAYPLILKTLIHMASDVTGELDCERFDALDALLASFPAGTLSGAPKIRATELIDELETSHRGVYGGCLMAIDHDNNLDSCIVIRNALIKDQKIFVRAGCGVVYDSDPVAEANETRHKAAGVLDAIASCQT